MLITRKDPFTGEERAVDLPITGQQLLDWQTGTLAQVAFPNLTPSQREFIISGIGDSSWERIFGK